MQINSMNNVSFNGAIRVYGSSENINKLERFAQTLDPNSEIVDLQDSANSWSSIYNSKDSSNSLYAGQKLALLTGKDYADYVTEEAHNGALLRRAEATGSIDVDRLDIDRMF